MCDVVVYCFALLVSLCCFVLCCRVLLCCVLRSCWVPGYGILVCVAFCFVFDCCVCVGRVVCVVFVWWCCIVFVVFACGLVWNVVFVLLRCFVLWLLLV